MKRVCWADYRKPEMEPTSTSSPPYVNVPFVRQPSLCAQNGVAYACCHHIDATGDGCEVENPSLKRLGCMNYVTPRWLLPGGSCRPSGLRSIPGGRGRAIPTYHRAVDNARP
jgi:hypothetical protein